MSLAIDVDKVEAVLLSDGWHDVLDQSFELDSYEYLYREDVLLGGGVEKLVPATGFLFKTCRANSPTKYTLAGPLTAIQAVRYGTESR